MKFSVFIFLLVSFSTMAQDAEVMEKKARELYRVICLNDKEQWMKFVRDHYTPALIAKPINGKVMNNGSETNLSDVTKGGSDIEAKANLLARLHHDFGNGKLISVMPESNKVKMMVNNDQGLTATFDLTFDKNNMIDRFGVIAGN